VAIVRLTQTLNNRLSFQALDVRSGRAQPNLSPASRSHDRLDLNATAATNPCPSAQKLLKNAILPPRSVRHPRTPIFGEFYQRHPQRRPIQRRVKTVPIALINPLLTSQSFQNNSRMFGFAFGRHRVELSPPARESFEPTPESCDGPFSLDIDAEALIRLGRAHKRPMPVVWATLNARTHVMGKPQSVCPISSTIGNQSRAFWQPSRGGSNGHPRPITCWCRATHAKCGRRATRSPRATNRSQNRHRSPLDMIASSRRAAKLDRGARSFAFPRIASAFPCPLHDSVRTHLTTSNQSCRSVDA